MKWKKTTKPSTGTVSLPFSNQLHAANKLEIRSAILDGDIDKALKHTKAYYANVLEANPQIHFKLRCRKFLEMMRHSNEISTRPPSAHSHEHAVFDHEMELDDDTDGSFNQLLTEAVQYGQQLRADYPNDDNGGDKKLLDDIFSLVAYPDPKRSVHGHYLETKGRVAVAEELNSAILGMYFVFAFRFSSIVVRY